MWKIVEVRKVTPKNSLHRSPMLDHALQIAGEFPATVLGRKAVLIHTAGDGSYKRHVLGRIVGVKNEDDHVTLYVRIPREFAKDSYLLACLPQLKLNLPDTSHFEDKKEVTNGAASHPAPLPSNSS
jgi:hypothetical protein